MPPPGADDTVDDDFGRPTGTLLVWNDAADWSNISALELPAIERAADPGVAAMPPFSGVAFKY